MSQAPSTAPALILLVDDESSVRLVCTRMLERLGYRVVATGSGQEALEELTKLGASLELVVLDSNMPEMSGEETASAMLSRFPELRIVVSSGSAENEVRARFAGCAIAGFLQKPYRSADLAEVVRLGLGASS